MTVTDIYTHLQKNSTDLTNEFKRLFHGRGGLYDGWKHLTIDSIDDILSIALYFEMEPELESELIDMLNDFIKSGTEMDFSKGLNQRQMQKLMKKFGKGKKFRL